ncbi:30S ribosomal protein S6 [Liparis tanakae]|uniref:30S ribosomal protein S6 n=1 Tax=Liparis tanakae TaxID=230148 RepID=A0A4Z2DZ67_9TELE|nr:30S ribosomal protein S6 [Liparis tanakae]
MRSGGQSQGSGGQGQGARRSPLHSDAQNTHGPGQLGGGGGGWYWGRGGGWRRRGGSHTVLIDDWSRELHPEHIVALHHRHAGTQQTHRPLHQPLAPPFHANRPMATQNGFHWSERHRAPPPDTGRSLWAPGRSPAFDRLGLAYNTHEVNEVNEVNKVNEVKEVNKLNEVKEVNEVNEVNKVNEVNEVNVVKEVNDVNVVKEVNEVNVVKEVNKVNEVNVVKEVNKVNVVKEVNKVNVVKEVNEVRDSQEVDLRGGVCRGPPQDHHLRLRSITRMAHC